MNKRYRKKNNSNNKNYNNNQNNYKGKNNFSNSPPNPTLIEDQPFVQSMNNPNHLDKFRYTIFYIADKLLFKLEVSRNNLPERRYVFDYRNYLDAQFFPDIRLVIIEKNDRIIIDENLNPVLVESEKKIKEDFKKRSTTFNMVTFPRFLTELEIILNELRSPGLFKYDDNDQLILNELNAKKYIHYIRSSFDDIIIEPWVVQDNNKVLNEGIKLTLIDDLKKEHIAYLTYDEFYAMYWNLSKIDIHDMTMNIYFKLYFKPVKNDNKFRR